MLGNLFLFLGGAAVVLALMLNDRVRQWWTGVDKATELDELFGDWVSGKATAGKAQLDDLADAVAKKLEISK